MRWKGGLAVWLAGAAGVVDATGLAGVGRYSSHMTGTTTHSMVGSTGGDLSLLGCELWMRLRGWAGLETGKALASPDQETMVSAGLPMLGFAAGAVLHLVAGPWSGVMAAAPPALAMLWLLAAAPVGKPA